MQRKNSFLVVCISIITTPLWGQTGRPYHATVALAGAPVAQAGVPVVQAGVPVVQAGAPVVQAGAPVVWMRALNASTEAPVSRGLVLQARTPGGGLTLLPGGNRIPGGMPARETTLDVVSGGIRGGLTGDALGGARYVGQLGFFCRKEYGFEQATHIPLRLRLGSLADCNRLEGKPGW